MNTYVFICGLFKAKLYIVNLYIIAVYFFTVYYIDVVVVHPLPPLLLGHLLPLCFAGVCVCVLFFLFVLCVGWDDLTFFSYRLLCVSWHDLTVSC